MSREDPINWLNIAISAGTALAGAITAIFARGFRQGKVEAEQGSTNKELENMIANVIKNQVAGGEQLAKTCELVNDMNLRLTKLETQVSERDKYSRGRDPGGYGRFRDRQEASEEDDRLFRERGR